MACVREYDLNKCAVDTSLSLVKTFHSISQLKFEVFENHQATV